MKFLNKLAHSIVYLAKNSILITCIIIFIIYTLFNYVEAQVEILIYGERFEHSLDTVFLSGFILFTVYCIIGCLIEKDNKK